MNIIFITVKNTYEVISIRLSRTHLILASEAFKNFDMIPEVS